MQNYLKKLAVFFCCSLYAETGFYLGAQLGFDMLSAKRSDSAVNDSVPPISTSFANNKKTFDKNAEATLFLGYLHKWNALGLGAEVFLPYAKLNSTISGSIYDGGIPITHNFTIRYKVMLLPGIQAKIGYFFKDQFFYTIFGVQSLRIQFEQDCTIQAVAAPVQATPYKNKRYTTAGIFGLGWQRPITEHVAIGFEAKFTSFSKKGFDYSYYDAAAGLTTTTTSNLKGQIYSTALRVMYVF